MRTSFNSFNLFKYNELSQKAKENVHEWLTNDDEKITRFTEYCENCLAQSFPNSKLTAKYSLSHCQGDGFNIEGTVSFFDALSALDCFDKNERETLEDYFEGMDTGYAFEDNKRYGYSCKFIDKQQIEECVDDFVDNLKCAQCKNVDAALIKKFYSNMIDFFEKKDKEFEKEGYEYFSEIDESEAASICESNNYEFFQDGSVYLKLYACDM